MEMDDEGDYGEMEDESQQWKLYFFEFHLKNQIIIND